MLGFPRQLKLHLVMDNYGTHKEPHVQAWLKTHPRFVRHFCADQFKLAEFGGALV